MSAILIAILRKYWLDIAIGGAGLVVGMWLAWNIQDVRLQAAEQRFVQYKIEERDAEIRREAVAQKQREIAKHDYEVLSARLSAEIEDGDVLRRCIAAGKCGKRVSVQPAPTCGGGLPAASVPDASRPDAVPSTGGSAAEVMPVVNDCAITTLRLNQLQADIERQPGY